MERTNLKTSFNGLAVIDRPIIIDNQPIYGVLFNVDEENILTEKGRGNINEYIAYLVGSEQFMKNGGTISEDCKVWYLPDGVHSFLNNSSLHRIVSHLMKGMVTVKKYEFDDFIVVLDGETDNDDLRIVLNKNLIDRYTDTIQKNNVGK